MNKCKVRVSVQVQRHLGGGRHNDRSNIDYVKNMHIDLRHLQDNIYLTCFKNRKITFDEAEIRFYEKKFSEGIKAQNERHKKRGHKKRIKNVEMVWRNPKTAPDEFIFQIGDTEVQKQWDSLTRELMRKILLRATLETIKSVRKEGEGFRPIDVAVHGDEASIHLHMRGVYVSKDRYGYWMPCQRRALEAIGFTRPNPERPVSRYNNVKVTFTNYIREIFLEKVRELIEINRLDMKIEDIRHPSINQKHMPTDEYKKMKNYTREEKMVRNYMEEKL